MELACTLHKPRKPRSCPNLIQARGAAPKRPLRSVVSANGSPRAQPVNLAKLIMDRRADQMGNLTTMAIMKTRTAPPHLQMLELKRITGREEAPAKAEEDAKVFRNKSFHHVGLAIVIVGGFVMGSNFYSRNFLPIAMLGMVNRTYLFTTVYPNTTLDNLLEPGYVEKGEFNWSNEMQQTIGLAYMIPYTVPQLAMTRLSLSYGLRRSITVWLLLVGLSNLFIPWLAYVDWRWVLVMRFLDGLFASPFMPTMIAAIEVWIPEKKATFALSIHQFVFTTIYLLVPLVSGYITSISWSWTFYSSSIISVVIALIWWLIARESPDSCSFISQKELEEWREAKKSSQAFEESPIKLPWYFMAKVKSFYFLALVYTLFCCIEASTIALLPTYFRKIMAFTTAENGFYNFLIQIGINFAVIWPQPVIVGLQHYCHLSLTSARQVVVLIYTLASCLAVLYIGAYHRHQIVLLIIFKFFFKANHLVLTATIMSQFGESNSSALVFSLINTIGNLLASVFCWFAGLALDYTGESRQCWSLIFVTWAVMHAILFLIYYFFLNSKPVDLSKFELTNKQKDQVKA